MENTMSLPAIYTREKLLSLSAADLKAIIKQYTADAVTARINGLDVQRSQMEMEFFHLVPNFWDDPDGINAEILFRYLQANNLPLCAETLAVAALKEKSKLIPKPTKDNRSREQILQDAGYRSDSSKQTAAEMAESTRKSKALVDQIQAEIRKAGRRAAYLEAKREAIFEASTYPHSRRPAKLAELMAKIDAQFPELKD